MHQLIRFLTFAYLKEATAQHTLGKMVKICFFSIALASCSLALICSIMSGFEKATHKTLQNIHADIIIESYERDIDEPFIKNSINDFPEVIGYSASKSAHALVGTSERNNLPEAIIIKGVNPADEIKTSALNTMIISSSQKDLSKLLDERAIIIGHKLAQQLNVLPGDHIELYYATDYQSIQRKLHLNTQKAKIAALFKTGIDEFDSSMAYSSLVFFDNLFEQEIDTVALRVKPETDAAKIIAALKKKIPYEISSWKELYPSICSALKLERYAMLSILALIILVASMTIVALIYMLITHKKNDIALLRAMGCSITEIRFLFLCIGICITLPATILGLLLAIGFGFYCTYCIPLELPDAYYVTHLPIDLNLYLYVIIGLFVFVMVVLASLLPLSGLKRLPLSSNLR
jgi:lipoprotein-releasing system permease protein